ncbi:MAG: DNA primase, partial [Planctomycetia bacterium]|nr:DNA primase [Planctomycetia bacterium]
MPLPYAFRIVGPTWERRRLVDAGAAFQAYAACDDRAEVHREAYLSAFHFGEDFRQLLQSTGSTAGFAGACWSAWTWFDIDRADNLDSALADARRLAAFVLARYSTLDDDDLLAFYSGSKGFHIGIPSGLWTPPPAAEFHRAARRWAESLAERAGVAIDTGVYDKVRAFRAPNSAHPKTGRHKRRLSHGELMGLSLGRILQLAARPEPFDWPSPPGTDAQAVADWRDALTAVCQQDEAKAKRRAESNGTPSLNRLTLDFIRDGADHGDRHRLLFSAAANLAEF